MPELISDEELLQIGKPKPPAAVGQVGQMVEDAARRHGIDPALAHALVRQESGGNPNAISPVGARGVMQLMPATARSLGVRDIHDPAQNIEGGMKYLAQQLQTFGGNVPKALAAYNAGPGAVQKFGGIPPYRETQDYVRAIMARYGKSSHPVTLASRSGSHYQEVQDLLPTERVGQASAPQSPVVSDAELQAIGQGKKAQDLVSDQDLLAIGGKPVPSANPVVSALQRRTATATPQPGPPQLPPANVSYSGGISALPGQKPTPRPTSVSGAIGAALGVAQKAGPTNAPLLDPTHVRAVQDPTTYAITHPLEAAGDALKHVFAGNYAGAEQEAAKQAQTQVTVPKGKQKEVEQLRPLVQKFVDQVRTRAQAVEKTRPAVLPNATAPVGAVGGDPHAPNPASFPSTEAYLQARDAYQAQQRGRTAPTGDYASRITQDQQQRQAIYDRAAQQFIDLPRAIEAQGVKLTPYQRQVLQAAGKAQAAQFKAEMAKRQAGSQDVIANVAGYLSGMAAEELLAPWMAKAGGAIAGKVLPKLGAEGQALVQNLAEKPAVQAAGRILSPTRAAGNYAGGAGAQGVTDLPQKLTPQERFERANQAGMGAAAFGVGLHALGEAGGALGRALKGKPAESPAAPLPHPVETPAAEAPAPSEALPPAGHTFQDVIDAQAGIGQRAVEGVKPAEQVAKPDRVGSLNLDKLNIADEAKDLLRESYAKNADAIEGARRGVRTNEETKAAADTLLKREGITVAKLQKAHPGTAWNAEQLEAIGSLHLRLLRDVQEAEKAYRADDSVENLAKLTDATTQYQLVEKAHHGGAAEIGRALQARKMFKDAWEGEMARQRVSRMFEPLPDEVTKTLTPQAPEFGSTNTVFKKDAALQAKDRLSQKLGRLSSGVPVDLLPDLLHYGGYLVEGGLRQFEHWSKQMVADLGEDAAPHLKEVWDKLRTAAQERAKAGKAPSEEARKRLLEALGGKDPGPDVLAKLRAAGEDPYKLSDVIREQTKVSPVESLLSAYKSNLTSGPGTHFTNVLSTQLHMLLRAPDKFFAGVWDPVVSKLQGTAREHFVQEALPTAAGLRNGLQSGLADFIHTVKHGATAEQAAMLDLPTRELPGGVKNPLVLNTRLQSAEDSFNRALVYHQALHSEAVRQGLKEGLSGDDLTQRVGELLTDPEIKAAADKEASYYTFNSKPDKWAAKLIEARDAIPLGLGHFLGLPFLRTPINVAKSAFEHSPAGFLSALSRYVGKNGDVSEALGRATTGTLLLGLSGSMLKDAEITGDVPEDKSAKDDFYRSGRRPYAIKIGNRWFSYANMGPLTTLLAVTASMRKDYWEKGKQPENNVWAKATLDAAKSLYDQSALTGLSSLSDALREPDRFGQKYASSTITGLIPLSGLLRTTAKATDPNQRDAKTVDEAVRANIPGLSRTVPKRIDTLGREVMQQPGGALQAQRIYLGKSPNDLVDQELHRLQVSPSDVSKRVTVGLKKVELDRKQESRFREVSGQAVYRRLKETIRSNDYQRAPDTVKAEWLTAVIRDERSTQLDRLRAHIQQSGASK